MDTNNTESKSHEQLVQAMRAHWRREAGLREDRNEAAAEREKRGGDTLFNTLFAENKGLLKKYARGYFGGDDSLVEDGVQELGLALYKELRSLSDNIHSQLWEVRFARCLKAMAYALFTRRLQKWYGKSRPEKDPNNPDADRPYFEQTQTERLQGNDFDPLEAVPDTAAAETIPQLLQNAEMEALLEAIPNPLQREALWLSCLGWKQERIAAHQKCSVKTVYNRIAHATTCAAAWAKERYQTHGEFSDMIDG